MTEEDLVTKCRRIAEQAHAGQIRKFGDDKGKPYFIHPERVGDSFDKWLWALICAAYLHDTLEDTDITIDDLMAWGIPRKLLMLLLL